MRTFARPVVTILLLAAACTAFGAGGGSMPTPTDRNFATRSPETQALNAYNTGAKLIQKGDKLSADAAHQTDERKRKKAREKAQEAYRASLRKFVQAIEFDSTMHPAWNYLGYAQRKLGNYKDALLAYDRALQLKPGYPEAIEYRGHAYLGLDRLSEAKEAYLALFSGNRKLAARLLTAMQEWVGEHRGNAAGVDGAMLESFASWVNERSVIAGQTAGLTREGAASAWQ
jgi:tetratricopeptide (TPR) repeat protein